MCYFCPCLPGRHVEVVFTLQQFPKSLNLIDCIVVVAVFIDCSREIDEISCFVVEASAAVFLRIVRLIAASRRKSYSANLHFSYAVFSGYCRYRAHFLVFSRLIILRQHNLETFDVRTIDLGRTCQPKSFCACNADAHLGSMVMFFGDWKALRDVV
jgi:hypothetical protein